MPWILTNSNRRRDFTRTAMQKILNRQKISIAVAFFNDNTRFLDELIANGCTVRLIVRLGFPTDAYSLRRALSLSPSVHVKYFTSKQFHPKLYIFGQDAAIVGSSNFTDAGLMSNQEVNVLIPSEDERFSDLVDIFEHYWSQAQTLTPDIVQKYDEATRELQQVYRRTELAIMSAIPEVSCSDVEIPARMSQVDAQIRREVRQYQEFLHHFAHLKEVYTSFGRRKVPEEYFPIRLEIDQFLNWVYENQASQEYMNAPVLMGDDLSRNVLKWVKAYFESPSNTSEEVAVTHYRTLKQGLESREKIEQLDMESLVNLLLKVFAFEGYASRYQKIESFKSNPLDKIKSTLTFLLFGEGQDVERVVRCLHPPYKLNHVGENTIKELFGWVNRSDLPIFNQRVRKSMCWLGYDMPRD